MDFKTACKYLIVVLLVLGHIAVDKWMLLEDRSEDKKTALASKIPENHFIGCLDSLVVACLQIIDSPSVTPFQISPVARRLLRHSYRHRSLLNNFLLQAEISAADDRVAYMAVFIMLYAANTHGFPEVWSGGALSLHLETCRQVSHILSIGARRPGQFVYWPNVKCKSRPYHTMNLAGWSTGAP